MILAALLLMGGLGGAGAYLLMFRVDPKEAAKNQDNLKQNEALDKALGLDDDFDDDFDEPKAP